MISLIPSEFECSSIKSVLARFLGFTRLVVVVMVSDWGEKEKKLEKVEKSSWLKKGMEVISIFIYMDNWSEFELKGKR